jgi:hypothetical protein
VATRTAGSASGLGKRPDGNIDTAPQADSTMKVMTQLTQHAVHAIVLHRNQGDPIHPGRTPVLTHPLPRLPPDVTPCRHGQTGRGNADPKTA